MKSHYMIISAAVFIIGVTGIASHVLAQQAVLSPQEQQRLQQQVQQQVQPTTPSRFVSDPATAQETADKPVQNTDQSSNHSIGDQFKDLLSFPLTEEKMISYVQAARRVQHINDKWDVQIASVESNETAMDYNNYSVEEIMDSLKNIPGLTLDEYNEMTRVISTNTDFARVYQAYKEMVEQKRIPAPAAQPVKAQPSTKPVQASEKPHSAR